LFGVPLTGTHLANVDGSGMLTRTITAVSLTTVLLALPAAAAPSTASTGWSVDLDNTEQITRLTGPDSINDTGPKWNVYGTDLGSMFEHRGKVYLAFGDTFGPPGQPPEFGTHWRSNVLAWTKDRDPSDGLTFDGMITDEQGQAREVLPGAHFGDNADGDFEITVIPTGGISDNRTMYLHYMSVNHWGPPGEWDLNHSAIAFSEDDGQTWEVSDVRWDGDSNFGQVAFVKNANYLYIYGIPGGRFGGVALARVPMTAVLDQSRYQYWDGTDWVAEEEAAALIIPAPVGELSVQWNSHYGTWLMMYLRDVPDPAWGHGAVMLRTSECLAGPWTDEQVVVTAYDAPQLYAPYLPPRWNNGEDIYFTLSRFNMYDVFWWRTTLTGDVPKNASGAKCVTG
jgi:hypothetical protein